MASCRFPELQVGLQAQVIAATTVDERNPASPYKDICLYTYICMDVYAYMSYTIIIPMVLVCKVYIRSCRVSTICSKSHETPSTHRPPSMPQSQAPKPPRSAEALKLSPRAQLAVRSIGGPL